MSNDFALGCARSMKPDPWGEEIGSYQRVLTMVEKAADGLILKIAK